MGLAGIAVFWLLTVSIHSGLYDEDDDMIYVGTFAMCGDCQLPENAGCTGKCITFRDNTGDRNLNSEQFLAEVCWQIDTCAMFPKFYAFQTDKQCANECEVNIFPGFSRYELNNVELLYRAKGYEMMCLEYSSSDSPLPNICDLAKPYAKPYDL